MDHGELIFAPVTNLLWPVQQEGGSLARATVSRGAHIFGLAREVAQVALARR